MPDSNTDFEILQVLSSEPGMSSFAPITDQNSKENFQFRLSLGAAFSAALDSSHSRYLWQRSFDGTGWSDTNSTGLLYTPTDWDVGAYLRGKLSYRTKTGVSGTIFSDQTPTIENINDAPDWSALALTAQARQGSVLTLTGFITDDDNLRQSDGRIDTQTLDIYSWPVLSMEWRADGVPIEGAVGVSFIPGQSEVGKLLSVFVSYTDAQGTLESTNLIAPAVTANVNDLPEGVVWIEGTLRQDEFIYARHSLSDLDGPSEIYSNTTDFWQWFADDKEILGANGESLRLTQALVGSTIKVRARYIDGLNTQETIYGYPEPKDQRVDDVNDLPTGQLVVTASAYLNGSPAQGAVLTAASSISNPIADPDGIPHAGQDGEPLVEWFLDDDSPLGTGPTFMLGQSVVGRQIYARYSYTDLGQFRAAEEIRSDTLGPVVDTQDAPQSDGVMFFGELIEGSTVVVQLESEHLDADGIVGDVVLQWLGNGAAIDGRQSVELPLTQSEVGKLISIRLDYVDGGGRNETLTVPVPWGRVGNLDNIPEGGVWIVDAPVVQYSTLTVAHDLTDADGIPAQGSSGAISYQWFAGEGDSRTALLGETGRSLLLSQEHVNRFVSVAVSYTDNFGTVNKFEIDAGWVEDVPDAPNSTLSLSGELLQHRTLSVVGGISDLDLGGTIPFDLLTFRWFSGDDHIADAIGSSIVLAQDNVGKVIRVEVWYDAENSFIEIRSPSPVRDVDDPPVGLVRLSGEFVEDGQLWVTPEISDLDLSHLDTSTLSFAWFADGFQIPNEFGDSLILGPAEVNRSITVRASYLDPFGSSHVFSSASPLIANAPDPPEGNMWISGAPVEGGTLEVIGYLFDRDGIMLDSNGQPNFDFQWLADGQDISGATGRSYQPGQSQVGMALSVRVSYTDLSPVPQQETYETPSTDLVGNVDDAPVGSLLLGGDLIEHSVITAIPDFFDADGVQSSEFKWSWFSREKLTDPWTLLPGEINDQLNLSDSLIGKQIRVDLSYVDDFSNLNRLSVDSGAARVRNLNDLASARVWIDGYDPFQGVFQGDTVSINVEGLADPDGIPPLEFLTFQWYLDGQAIYGANGSQITLEQRHVGGELAASVLFWDGRGTLESLTSDELLVVQNTPEPPVGALKILGLAEAGQILHLESSLGDPDGISRGISFQWMSSGGEIADAHGTAIRLTPDLIGQTIGLRAVWTDDWGQDEAVEVWMTGAPVSRAPIEGGVYHWKSLAPIAGVELKLVNPDDQAVPVRSRSDASGKFRFEGLDFDQYQLSGNLNSKTRQAVDTTDLLALMKLVAGRNPNPDRDGIGPERATFVSPYQLVAADVDDNGRVDHEDVTRLLQTLTSSHGESLPWRFVSEPDWSVDRKETLSQADRVRLVGVPVGDIDGSWSLSGELGWLATSGVY